MSGSAITYQRNYLIDALVGPDRRALYQTSPEFKASIDAIVRVLPHLVATFAESAKAADVARERITAMLNQGPLMPPPGETECVCDTPDLIPHRSHVAYAWLRCLRCRGLRRP